MSLHILALGTLNAAPIERTSNSGRLFVTATLRVATDEGPVSVSVAAFSDSAKAALLALSAGDSVTVTGRAKLTTWAGRDGEARQGVSVVAEGVLSAYMVRGRREASKAARAGLGAAERSGEDRGARDEFSDMNPLNA